MSSRFLFSLSRREMLQQCMAMGAITIASSVSRDAMAAAFEERERELRKPTPSNDLGPFYKRRAPNSMNLRATGDPGLPLGVSGRVFDTRGQILPQASLEVWQTDHYGHYDIEGYRYRSTLIADSQGEYKFDSVMPGHYPDRVCQHIHCLVTAPGCKPLITQLYFASDRVFDGDPDRNFTRDPLIHSRELVRPVILTGDPKDIKATVRFDLCLERA
jgi:protocatechuate 3,4-dioxygenase beta subunit